MTGRLWWRIYSLLIVWCVSSMTCSLFLHFLHLDCSNFRTQSFFKWQRGYTNVMLRPRHNCRPFLRLDVSDWHVVNITTNKCQYALYWLKPKRKNNKSAFCCGHFINVNCNAMYNSLASFQLALCWGLCITLGLIINWGCVTTKCRRHHKNQISECKHNIIKAHILWS